MKYRTAIHNVEFYAFHGIYPEERMLGGRFLVEAVVEMDIHESAALNSLAEVVNYEKLYSIVKSEMDQPRDLIETVAKSVLDLIGQSFNKLSFAEVKITKLAPGGVFKTGRATITLSITQ